MTPLIFSQPQVPPSKEFATKPQGPPPPWISNYCASMPINRIAFDVVCFTDTTTALQ